MLGTATAVRGYLLIEEPGAWGPGAVPASRLGAETTDAVRRTAQGRGLKLLLIRRHGTRDLDPHGPRRLFLVDVRRGHARTLTRTTPATSIAHAAAAAEGWSPHGDQLLLVCTHGKKDWCCALRGRPVVAALAALDPDPVWECSHLGGDRFAATALSLPSGITHGRLSPDDAPALLAALQDDRVLPHLLRGRSCDPGVVQAAEGHVRLQRGIDGIEALRPRAVVDEEGGRWRVDLEHGGRVFGVHLRVGSAPAHRLTCSAIDDRHARTWELEHID